MARKRSKRSRIWSGKNPARGLRPFTKGSLSKLSVAKLHDKYELLYRKAAKKFSGGRSFGMDFTRIKSVDPLLAYKIKNVANELRRRDDLPKLRARWKSIRRYRSKIAKRGKR